VTSDDSGALRYHVHDLTRAFARERGDAEESEAEVRAACTRAAESWLTLVETAGQRMPHAQFGDGVTPTPSPYLDPDLVDELLTDPEAWFDAEQSDLVGVVERISELDLTDIATRLAAALCSSRFSVRNLFGQWWRTHSAALGAARRVGDRTGEARLLSGLGWLRYEQDRFDESAGYFEQALEAYAHTADARGLAMTRLALSTVRREHGELVKANESLHLALPELRALDEPHAVAQAEHELGRVLTEQGDLDGALATCERTLAAYRSFDDRRGTAIALRSVGIVLRAAGRLDEAAERSEAAVDILSGLGDRLMSAYAVQALAKVRIRQGRGDAVRSDLLECLATCNDMQDGFGQALLLRTLGELEQAVGRPEVAHRYLERSLQWWDALSLPVWRARTLRDLASVLAALGDRHGADQAWTEALAIFERHGSREAREPRPQSALNPA
jgi:tetratricopeptide (TPR) repeat protein